MSRLLKLLHAVRIYPHDRKRVIFQKDGYFHTGLVTASATLTGGEPLEGMDETRRLREIFEAANGLGVPPRKIEQRLTEGKKVVFHPHSKERR